MDALEFLQDHVGLFSGMSEEQLTPLAQASHLETFKKGQSILFKGMTVDGLHVLCTGAASVHVKTGKVADLGFADVFGEVSILEMGTAGATVKAEEEGTTVLVIPQDAFRTLLADQAFVARVRALIDSRKPPEKPKAE